MVLALLTYLLIAAVILVRWRRSGRSFGGFIGLGTVRLYARLWHGCLINAPVAVPATGPAILVANHTSSSDGTFLQVGSVRGLTFLFAREYYDGLPLLRWVWHSTGCVPVTRGVCDIRAVRQALRRLEEGRVVVVFPEGNLSGAGSGRLRTAKGGAALLALRTRAPVFPVFVSGGPQGPDVGRAWFWPSRVRVTYGPVLDLSPYYDRPINRRLLEEVTAFLMAAIAATGKKRGQGSLASGGVHPRRLPEDRRDKPGGSL